MDEMKICTRCKKEFPATAEWFYIHKRNGSLHGDFLETRCKKCCAKISMNYRKRNPDKRRETSAKSYIKHREKEVLRRRKNSKNNRDRINARRRIRISENPVERLNNSMRSRIYIALVENKAGRRWLSFVDYTLEELKQHIENLFIEGMTWDNYGKWHIDHKIPIAAYNFTKPEHEDFKRCWALDNLQPMWALDNLKKNAKISKPFQPSLLIGGM